MSEEQNLDRHTDPSGLVESMRHANSGLPYLGDHAAVEQIVREFASEIITRYDEVGHGVLTPSDAAGADRMHCEKLGRAFAGQDPAYAPQKEWNGPGLANHLRATMAAKLQPEDDDGKLIGQFFGVFVHGVYDALRELAGGADEEAVQQTLDGNVRQTVQTLMGVQKHG